MDYTRDAILEDLVELEIQQKDEVMEMLKESEYLQACYENQVVGLMEAQGDSVIASIIRATQAMFARITEFFRKSSIHKFEKRFNKESLKRIRANLDKVKQNATNLAAQKMTPYWNADHVKDKSAISTATQTAFNNLNNKKYDDYGFASKFVKNTQLVKTRDTELRNYLLNYFRYNDNDMPNPESITVTGKDIASHVEEMLNYIENFSGTISAMPGQVSDSYNKGVRRIRFIADLVTRPVTQQEKDAEAKGEPIKVSVTTDASGTDDKGKTPTPESIQYRPITPDTYFTIEEKYASETMLPFFMGYPVTEAKKKQKNTNNNTANGDENVSPTNVQDAEPKKEDSTNNNNTQTTNQNKTNEDDEAQRKEYFNNINSFLKLALTSYQTAIEERFVVYSKLIYLIAKEFIDVPKEQVEKATKQEAELAKKSGIGGKGKKKKK